MKLDTDQLNKIAQLDYPQLQAQTYVKGTDPLFLAKIKNEKCHQSTKKHNLDKVAAVMIDKLRQNGKRLAPTLKNVENYDLERKLQTVEFHR